MIRQIAARLPADFNSDAPFNPEVYLRIPEYLYEQDDSPGHAAYYRAITEILKSEAPANPIDELIFEIRPHHIVTTNVDDLLERSDSLNTRLYAVVSQDADLLSVSSDRYLIKMHGDIKDPKTVVVKESDYLDYEQNHPLVATFIRSLLINHTFLFIGYSLNDYNLNLILNWINFFRKQHRVARRPQNILVQTKTPSPYEVRRLASRNLSVVDLNTLPEVILRRAPIPPSLTAPFGRRLYAYLRCVTDDRLFQHVLSLADTLDERLTPLLAYGRIAADDLLGAFDFGPTELVDTTLILKDPEMFRRLIPVFKDRRGVAPAAFARAGIDALACAGEPPFALPDCPTRTPKAAALLWDYLDNRALDLQDDLETASPAAQIGYGLSAPALPVHGDRPVQNDDRPGPPGGPAAGRPGRPSGNPPHRRTAFGPGPGLLVLHPGQPSALRRLRRRPGLPQVRHSGDALPGGGAEARPPLGRGGPGHRD